jgi:exonuclease III
MTQIEGRKEEIVIHNVYNPIEKNGDPRHREGRYEGITTNSAIPLLESALEKHHGKEQLVVGDFNTHHSKWDGNNYQSSRNPSSAQTDFMTAMMER